MSTDDMDPGSEATELRILKEVSTILASSLDLGTSIQRFFEIIESEISLIRGVVFLVEPEMNGLQCKMAFRYSDEERAGGMFQFIQSLCETVLSSTQNVVVPDIGTDTDVIPKSVARDGYSGTSLVCIPIVVSEEKLGVLGAKFNLDDVARLPHVVHMLSFVSLLIALELRLKRVAKDDQSALRQENTKLREELTEKYNIHNMIGNSSAMHEVYESITQVAESNATVIIRGESGTGKELVAHAIHYNSPRKNKPFVKINCGAIPEGLIESELFGYEKGAFTDAQELKRGKFEMADGGTIFLDEIGELSTALQVKLLRVLQEREFERVGGVESIKINVRIVTATNRDLEKEMEANRFRQDLYYRLNVFPIFLPPLRERKTDLLLLAEHFLEKFAKENGKEIVRISSLAIDLLSSYHWPGNVRELENCMERSVLLCKGDAIQSTHLPPTLQRAGTTGIPSEELSFTEMVGNFEREIIIDALKKARGNKSKAAELLNTTSRIIGYKIESLGIDTAMFRA